MGTQPNTVTKRMISDAFARLDGVGCRGLADCDGLSNQSVYRTLAAHDGADVPGNADGRAGLFASADDPKMKPSTDPREIEPVKRVAARVIEAAKNSKYSEIANQFEWEVTVIKDDKTMNAFALPGGKIAVYTGIFPVAKTEAGLAAVMGHEVVHALARHGGNG